MKFWKKKPEKKPDDYFVITIAVISDTSKEKQVIARGEGSILEWVDIEEKRYWTYGDPYEEWKLPEFVLPSDLAQREDHPFYLVKDYANA